MAVKIRPLKSIQQPSRIRMVLYGETGVGKTTLCDTLENVLFLEFDQGGHYSILDSANDNRVVEVETIKDLEIIYGALSSDLHGIGTIVFDSMTTLQEMSIDFQRAHASGAPTGMALTEDLEIQLRDYKMTNRQVSKILGFFGKLDVDLVFICHTRDIGEDEKTMMAPDLIPSLRTRICKNASVVGRLIIRREVDREANRAVNVRYLVCSPQPGFVARSRLAQLNRSFKRPNLRQIFGLIKPRPEIEEKEQQDANGDSG